MKTNSSTVKICVSCFISNKNKRISTFSPSAISAVAHSVGKKIKIEQPHDINKSKPLTQRYLKLNVDNVLSDMLVSCDSPWNPRVMNLSDRQQMIFNILRGDVPPIKEILHDRHLVPAVIFKKNTKLLEEARELVQKIFDDMSSQLVHKAPLSESDNLHMEMIIGDMLALYPFLRPQKDEVLSVPVFMDNQWKKIDYKIDKIMLTPRWMGSPITAYGLTAKGAPPHLLFKGTTYPTDEGFSLSLLTDINPLGCVGDYVFKIGKEKIAEWLEANVTSRKAIVAGKSLGGIEACLAAIAFPDKVQKVNAYGAPGFSLMDLKRLYYLHDHQRLPDIRVFCQKNDPVPYTDRVAKKGVKYYQVISSKLRHGVMAHADMYSMHKNTLILKWDPYQDSSKVKRIGMTLFRSSLSYLAFPFLILFHSVYTAIERAGNKIKKLS